MHTNYVTKQNCSSKSPGIQLPVGLGYLYNVTVLAAAAKPGVWIAKITNTCTELYHSFIQYAGTYMFQQWSAIIRELLGFI
jgi:hypothetical protein